MQCLVRRHCLGVCGVGSHEKMAAGTTSGFWFAEVGGAAVYNEYHVARAVSNDCILMGGGIIQEKFSVGQCFCSGCGLD